IIARGDVMRVSESAALVVNGAIRVGHTTIGGTVITALTAGWRFALQGGAVVQVVPTSEPTAPLDVSLAVPSSAASSAGGLCSRSVMVALPNLGADLRVTAVPGPPATAGAPATFTVEVENVGPMIHSISVTAPPSWGTATGW